MPTTSDKKSPIIITTHMQIYILLAISLIIGVLFGAIFGIVDIEDYSKKGFILYIALTREIKLCEPIGFVFGVFTGFMIEFLRQ
jgi:hypothetical protein